MGRCRPLPSATTSCAKIPGKIRDLAKTLGFRRFLGRRLLRRVVNGCRVPAFNRARWKCTDGFGEAEERCHHGPTSSDMRGLYPVDVRLKLRVRALQSGFKVMDEAPLLLRLIAKLMRQLRELFFQGCHARPIVGFRL